MNNDGMDEKPITTSSSASGDLQKVLDHLATGTPLEPDLMRRVRERSLKIRQEILDKHGILDVAVELIRETRDEA